MAADREPLTAARPESWENVYSGLDRKTGGTTTRWVIEAIEQTLPNPEISPVCKRKGHDWGEPAVTPLDVRASVRGCRRCMKRGLLVIRTEAAGGR